MRRRVEHVPGRRRRCTSSPPVGGRLSPPAKSEHALASVERRGDRRRVARAPLVLRAQSSLPVAASSATTHTSVLARRALTISRLAEHERRRAVAEEMSAASRSPRARSRCQIDACRSRDRGNAACPVMPNVKTRPPSITGLRARPVAAAVTIGGKAQRKRDAKALPGLRVETIDDLSFSPRDERARADRRRSPGTAMPVAFRQFPHALCGPSFGHVLSSFVSRRGRVVVAGPRKRGQSLNDCALASGFGAAWKIDARSLRCK